MDIRSNQRRIISFGYNRTQCKVSQILKKSNDLPCNDSYVSAVVYFYHVYRESVRDANKRHNKITENYIISDYWLI